MSWESTALYYKYLNTLTLAKLGEYHSARILLVSVDFHEMVELQNLGKWNEAADVLSKTARQLEAMGAEIILLCTNTMHRVADEILGALRTSQFVHICDATSDRVRQDKAKAVGFLGTKITMEQDFYVQRLRQSGLEVFLAEVSERKEVNRIIFEELVSGKILDSSRKFLSQVIDRFKQKGADSLVLGCTELGLIVQDAPIKIYDPALIHCEKAVELAI